MFNVLFKSLFDAFENNNQELFVVGGAIRDLMQARLSDDLRFLAQKNTSDTTSSKFFLDEELFWEGVKSARIDVDFATSALPEETIKILKSLKFKVIPIGIEFGTIQTIIDDVKIEITTFRSNESYTKGDRKPSVKFGKSIEEDLARRDFTLNSMAMNRNMKLIDPFHGYADLIQGVLWTPIDAEVSFSDDPLRMLRTCRFWARGVAQPSWKVGDAMKKLAHKIHDISQERIFEELTKMLVADNPEKGLKLLVDSGLLKEIFPELQRVVEFDTVAESKDLWAHTVQVVQQCLPDPTLRWSALVHDIGKPDCVMEKNWKVSFHGHEERGAAIWEKIADRLRVSKEFKESVSVVISQSGLFIDLSKEGVTDKSVRRFIRKNGKHLDRIAQFTLADMTSKKKWKIEKMQKSSMKFKERIDKIIEQENIAELSLPKGTGTILMDDLFIKGKRLGDVMNALTQKLIDGEITLESNFVAEARVIMQEKDDR